MLCRRAVLGGRRLSVTTFNIKGDLSGRDPEKSATATNAGHMSGGRRPPLRAWAHQELGKGKREDKNRECVRDLSEKEKMFMESH